MFKNKDVLFAVYIIVFLAVWNLADYLYTTFIAKEAYHFAASTDGTHPGVVAIISGYILLIRKKSD